MTSIYGGVGYGKQLADLRNGVDILIACPGRLTDLIERRSVDLSFVDIVVLDEADRMADMGFLPTVRRLVERTSASRQVLLFSATLDGPVDKLVRDYQHDPVRHDVVPASTSQGVVGHHFWRVDSGDRVAVAAKTIAAHGPAVVFCRTKRGADRLSDRLARSGLRSAAIHGNRSQGQRERALADFRAGRVKVLVATDIAARGIHVDAVPLVLHFDPPADATDYVHRAGRTGRAGADGIVVSLVGPGPGRRGQAHPAEARTARCRLLAGPGIARHRASDGRAGRRWRERRPHERRPHERRESKKRRRESGVVVSRDPARDVAPEAPAPPADAPGAGRLTGRRYHRRLEHRALGSTGRSVRSTRVG